MEVEDRETEVIETNQRITQQQQEAQQIEIQLPADRPKYGKYIILCQFRSFIISIGPDYKCFISGFLSFFLLSIILIINVQNIFKSQLVIRFTYIICFIQCASYLLVALSNPSIRNKQNNRIKKITAGNKHKFCQMCGVQRSRKTYHCRTCDVCIDGYDHHCMWVSKCIGKGNIYFFNFFVTVTPIYIISFIFLFMTILTLNAIPHQQSKVKVI